MKVAMIGLRGIPAKTGGVENVVEHLAPRLAKLGADVTVYCRNPYSQERPKTFKGVKLKYLPTINTKHTEALAHSFLSTINAMCKDYDIVHFHAMGNGMFSLLPRIKKTKTIVTLHGLDWEREKWGLAAKAFLKLSEKAICIFPNRTIAVSEKIKKYYKQRYNKEITFIPNGVEIQKPQKIKKLKRFGLKNNDYILFLSRIVPEKGLHTLIQAYRQTSSKAKLVIAGDATHTEDYLKKIKELAKGDKKIIFTGPLYGDDKTEAFSNCLFFILPSTMEGMPIVLLEAMSFGKCPLVSNIEENMSVIKDQGFSFKVGNVADLKSKLENMLNNPSLVKQKGMECKKAVKSKYNWDSIAKKTYRVYEDVLDEKKP